MPRFTAAAKPRAPQLTAAVYPWVYHMDIARQVENMTELSISRPATRVRWGVPVPGDPSQTVYVWVDALINYLTVAGFPGEAPAWPADMHVVGKDIIRFHALHWPALLAAAKLPLPKRILAHAHWTMGQAKMSKSRGNVADPLEAIDRYGADAVRWYLMRSGGSLAQDSDYSRAELSKTHDKLSSHVGNLAQRITSPKLLAGVKGPFGPQLRDADMDASLASLPDNFERRFNAYELTHAVAALEGAIQNANVFFTVEEPWRKADSTRAMVYAYATLKSVGILAQSIIPAKSRELLDRIGVPEDERTWAHAQWDGNMDAQLMRQRIEQAADKFKDQSGLFPRLEKEKIDVEAQKQLARQLKEKQRAESRKQRAEAKARAAQS